MAATAATISSDSDAVEIVRELSADEELARQFEEAKRCGRYIEIMDDAPDSQQDIGRIANCVSRRADDHPETSSALSVLPEGVMQLVIRHLSREALLRLTLTSQAQCTRVSVLLSNERTSVAIGFERRLHVPATFSGGVPQLVAFLRRLGSRFMVTAHSWVLRLVLQEEGATLSCSGMVVGGANGVFAAVSAFAFDIELVSTKGITSPAMSTIASLLLGRREHRACKRSMLVQGIRSALQQRCRRSSP